MSDIGTTMRKLPSERWLCLICDSILAKYFPKWGFPKGIMLYICDECELEIEDKLKQEKIDQYNRIFHGIEIEK